MLRSGGRYRRRRLLQGALLLSAFLPHLAQAQEDFPGFIIEPQLAANDLPVTPAAPAANALSAVPDAFGEFSNALGLVSQPGAPAWSIVPRIGVRETISDNGGRFSSSASSDDDVVLRSQIFGGVSIAGSGPQLSLNLDYNAQWQHRTANNQTWISHRGFAAANAAIIPDYVFLDVRGSAREIQRDGFGPSDPFLQDRSSSTQAFTFVASPRLNWRMGLNAFGTARYIFSRSWFGRNTGNLITPGGNIGPINDAERHQGIVQLSFPGTFLPRLLSTVVGTASSYEGGRIFGRLERASAFVSNEYQITRYLSAIGMAGYETLSHPFSEALSREGAIWQAGGRWRPNPNSFVAVTYGKQELAERWTGQAVYALSPLTTITVVYADVLGSSQLRGFGNLFGARIGAGGPFSGFGFNQNPGLGSLSGANLGGSFGGGLNAGAGGFPIFDSDEEGGFSSGFFRIKLLRGSIRSQIGDDNVTFTVFHSDREPVFAPGLAPIRSTGVRATWGHVVDEDLGLYASANYRHQDLNDTDFFYVRFGLNYDLGQSIFFNAHYAHLYRAASATSGDIHTNILTVALTKRFQ